MKQTIKINDLDNVMVMIEGNDTIPAGHKMALTDIPEGQPVIKYGNVIGYAKCDIKKGDWVHVHNVRTSLSGKLEYKYEPEKAGSVFKNSDGEGAPTAGAAGFGTGSEAGAAGFGTGSKTRAGETAAAEREMAAPSATIPTFRGYRRRSGVGVRNEIWIIPTVGCVNHIAEKLAAQFNASRPASIDAVVAMTHPYGCSQMGDDQEHTAMILGLLAHHPNCGGALILSLGCENNNLGHMKPYLEDIDEERTRFLVCQEAEDELEAASKLLNELIDIASKDERTDIPASELIVGLKCGGSDGFSGITANPLVGLFSDMLVGCGGSTFLTEVPEMFGAEQLLMNRAADEKIFNKTVSLINDFKDYYERNNQVIYENPSPGNKAGGITTLEDKSLGCVQKSGSAPVMDVLKYGERVCTKGLNLLEGPGNDMVAVTALAAAGAHIILFTTGRGTPLSAPVPTVKVSSNSNLAGRKNNWIDFDAGRLVSTDISAAELKQEFFEYVLRVASGEQVKSEEAGYHSMTIFKQGVTL